MDPRDTAMGGDNIDWNDPMFNSSQFDDNMTGDSPFAGNAFNDFTNFDSYAADGSGLSMRTPSKSGPAAASSANPGGLQPGHQPHPLAASAESSSQDSASDTSSQRKRKVTSQSPASDTTAEQAVKQEENTMDTNDGRHLQQFDQTFTRPMNDLSLDQEEVMGAHFDFNSAASSPIQTREFKPALTMHGQIAMPTATVASQYQQSPIQTINPGMFQIGSRDQSPVANAAMFNNASPTAIFSTPSSDSNENFSGHPSWNAAMAQNPAWPAAFSNQFTSPDGFRLTPSPVVNGATPVGTSRGSISTLGRCPLHIAPISTKSRVETQINIVMTLENPPPGIEHLHLPLHTIAKSKLLAKEEYEKSKVLELHTMLVCTSAMHNAQFKEKALQRAAGQNNAEIQRRADVLRDSTDEDKNDVKNVEEADKPANGGEVRICANCIQRERKRAGRKKLKKEEEQQHWERYETERVVVFNSNEYLPFKANEAGQPSQRESGGPGEDQSYVAPEGSLQVSAAMRIACYCRHQSEKEGFRVIFTLKDQQGSVVAQQMSDSILITDDHKTHPPSFSAAMPEDVYYHGGGMPQHVLPTSYSMVDLSSQAHPFTASRSTGNLQALGYGQQFNVHSHVHQMPGSGYASQATSATMTPTSLSRPGSPASAGQSGPNKKRKSSSFHRRVPSGLTMTPRVDTSQGPTSGIPSSLSMTSMTSFSPTSANGMGAQGDQSYMTIPNHGGPAHYYGSGPPTPSENMPFNFNQTQMDMARAQNAQAFFSQPSSAVPSRASSPVLQSSRPNMAAYARQPIQTPTNSIQGRQAPVYGGGGPSGAANEQQDQPPPPTITKITPADGPVSGGTDVAIYGYNFTNGTQVMFGEQLATTVFYGPQALLATSPPSRAGGVNVSLVPPAGSNQFASASTSRQIFTYTETNPKMMEMALRFLSQQQTGNSVPWNQFTNQVATKFIQSNMSPAGIHGQGFESGGNVMGNGVG